MCGIVGYTGDRDAQPILLDCLARLEYRGYDSCGIALTSPKINVYKDAFRVQNLKQSLNQLPGTTGLGHTRWATHGPPCKINAHPQTDCLGRIAVVHNGVITNYQKLKSQLIAEGHKFISETDTEVIPHLLEKYYRNDIEKAVSATLENLEGSYAIIVVLEGIPGLVFARKDSPLIIGVGDRENFLASDIPAVLDYTNRVIYLEDGDFGMITPNNIKINQANHEVHRKEQTILWEAGLAQKGGYEHYMLKEIHEQPKVIQDSLSEYLFNNGMPFSFNHTHKTIRNVLFLACGTSFHAALVGKYVCENLINISVNAEMASEFNYTQKLHSELVAVGITQSGETADTLMALRRSKGMGAKTVAITNVVGSTVSKIADHTIYARAGPEISVAATKSFIAQLMALYWLAISSSQLEIGIKNDLISEFRQLPYKVQRVLSIKNIVAQYSYELANHDHVFYIGRGINYAIAQEGALKLKEISYIHSEAFAAGEIKHGSFALLTEDTPVVAIIAQDSSYGAMLTNIKEIKARGSPVVAIAEEGDLAVKELADYVIPVPKISALFSPFVNTVVVQLIAYYAANKRNCPIDFPRNLAKCVTVE